MGGRIARAARTWLVVLGVALGATVLPASPAAAHNSLTGSDPKDGATVATAPKRIELRFLARLSPGTTKITVTGPDDASGSGGEPTFSGNRVSLPFTPGPAGVYTVAYQVGSTDGHPIKGKVSFTLTTGAAPATPSASASPTTAAPPTPAAGATPAASADPVASRSDEGGGSGLWWALGAVVALVALGGGLLLRRRSASR
ncbi:copper resistance protein CopC [Micromonospora sp. DR5-3]|uniref:copper resistance CopC family protein n=1 Tax=unclassified Micromonospora TaxID=2617518 RepID=UPI0011DB311C|nr:MULTISPECIES: copper resistance CopC family protein [unclassified Micromonospora]MCW3814147.1 copper resistance protein CopC [Micromonospora sp. DR5-3]TYC25031.1 copper resistance protein CopC [Micromonospora sp. MP36]